MYRTLVSLFVLSLVLGCKSEEPSIFSDEEVRAKCHNIVKNFDCWFDHETIKWLDKTEWTIVSTRQKDEIVAAVSKCVAKRYDSRDYPKVYALGLMDTNYSFERIACFKNSPCYMARGKVADCIPLTGKYKKQGLNILVELLFDSDARVRTGAACSITRRLENDESISLLLLYYFENIYQQPMEQTTTGRLEYFCDWVRKIADSKYRGVLVPWLEEIRDKIGRDPVREWMNYDGPVKWASWWHDVRVEQNQALVEGKQLAQKMKEKYRVVIRN